MRLLQSAALHALLGTGFVAFTIMGAAGNAYAQTAAYPSKPVTAIAPIVPLPPVAPSIARRACIPTRWAT